MDKHFIENLRHSAEGALTRLTAIQTHVDEAMSGKDVETSLIAAEALTMRTKDFLDCILSQLNDVEVPS